MRRWGSSGAGAKYQNRFFANARPDPDFRYFSNAIARCSSLNATWVLIRQGPYFEVWGTAPALCFANRARKSSVIPTWKC